MHSLLSWDIQHNFGRYSIISLSVLFSWYILHRDCCPVIGFLLKVFAWDIQLNSWSRYVHILPIGNILYRYSFCFTSFLFKLFSWDI